MFTSTVTQKGQVTIPKKLRDSLHLNINDKVIFVRRNDGLILKPVKSMQELQGSVPVKTKTAPEEIRKSVLIEVARRIADE